MKNKYIKLLLVLLLVVIVVPSVALAAWWNPLSWNWNIFNWFSKTQTSVVQPNKTANQNTTQLSIVTVTSPFSGEVVHAGSPYVIKWSAPQNLISVFPNVDIVMSVVFTNPTPDCGSSGCGLAPSNNIFAKALQNIFGIESVNAAGPLYFIIANNVPLSQGYYQWDVPSDITSQILNYGGYKILFYKAGSKMSTYGPPDQATVPIAPYKSNIFTLASKPTCSTNSDCAAGQACANGSCVATTQPLSTVTSPNGGERWAQGSAHDITWVSTGLPANATVNIGLVDLNTGSAYFDHWYDIATNVLESAGSYSWVVPVTLNGVSTLGNQWKVDVRYQLPMGYGSSLNENYFSIVAPTALTPVGLSFKNDVQAILDKLNAQMQVLMNQQGTKSSITCTPNWTCGWGPCVNGYQSQVVTDSNNCGLPSTSTNIICTTLSRVCQAQPSITVISPNGGEQLVRGQVYTIKWTSVGVNNVIVELDEYNLASGQLINGRQLTDSVSLPESSFSWKIPSDVMVGSDYKIRIWDFSNPSIISSSGNHFSIVAP